jgi:class 3 adenylate cyclase
MSQVLDPSLADRAKAALGRHAWREAFDLFTQADAQGALSPEEFELLAQSAWWVGQLPSAIEARERAYAASMKAGNHMMAAVAAINLGRDNLIRNAPSVATAWLNRAEGVLKGVDEGIAHGWLAVIRGLESYLVGDVDRALAEASRAHELAVRFGDRNLETVALSGKGQGLLALGQVEEGLALLDEATVVAMAGEIEPQLAGAVSCSSIGMCVALGDWRRVAEWTEAQDRWCKREQINGYPGMCRLHRAGVKRLRGAWLEAEAEARRATDELQGFIPFGVGLALYEIGEIRLRRGDFPAAEDALTRAHALGRDPEPALSLLRLAQGNLAAASASITRALEEPASRPSFSAPPNSELSRLALLPAAVEIELAAGDVAAARAAAEELGSLAGRFDSTAVRASAACSLGVVLVAEGDRPAGSKALREGVQLWGELDAPYEGARARMVLAEAYAAEGDRERAALEVQAARSAFEHLGATPDLRTAEAVLATLEDGSDTRPLGTATRRVVRTFVFTDIVGSTKFAEELGDEAWNTLIRWHDQAVRSLVAEHLGEEIKSIGDGFFLAFDDPDRAIECAIALQRRLSEQPDTHGLTLAVRIGIHRAEANRVGLDYMGTGVNQASRIAGHAAGGEILVSASTLEGSRREFIESDRRTIELKGISAPVDVVSIG